MAARSQHQLIPVTDAERWGVALAGLPHLPTLDWSYAFALRASVSDDIALYHYRTEQCELVCPLLLRQRGTCDVATPYGMSVLAAGQPDESFAEAFQQFARRQCWTTGYFACGANFRPEQWGLQTALMTPVLRLSIESEAEWLSAMQGNARRELHQWLARPPTISSDTLRILPWLLAEYPAFIQRVGAAPVYQFSDETLLRLLNSANCLAVAAIVDGNIEAASIFLYRDETAEYFLNVSSVAGRRHSRGLIWTAAGELRKRGVTQLNLGGGIRGEDSLFEFKKRLGSETVMLPVLKQVFERERYDEACRAAGLESINTTYFPPYLRPSRN